MITRFGVFLLAGSLAVLVPSAPVEGRSPTGNAGVPDVVSRADKMIEARDYAGAVELLESDGNVASPDVIYELAYAYYLKGTVGREVGNASAADLERALRLANDAVAAGNTRGYNLLHMIYEVEGLPHHDPARAAEFLRLGAEAGEAGAMLNYATELYYGTVGVPRDREKVCPFVDKLLEDQQVQALIAHVAGLILLNGECGKRADPGAGVDMIRIAASRGVTLAQRDLAVALSQGIGVEKNEQEALAWFEKAAENGDGESLWELGMAHVEGRLRPRDASRAAQYFQRSVDEGHPNGMVSLGVMYASGEGVAQDYGKTLELYSRAAALGHPHAHRGLAVMHALGQGVEVDRVRARVLYLQAVALGGPEEEALRELIESGMSTEDMHEADRRFAEWQARQ